MAAETQERYVVIIPTSGSTLYISDFEKTSYSQIILSWSPIRSTAINPIDYTSTPGQCSFVVANNVTIGGQSRFSNIPGLTFADIKIYQNTVLIFRGTIEDLTNIGNEEVTIQCIGKDAELSKLFKHTVIGSTNFPYADPAEIGKMLPVVYGDVKKVPFSAIDVGATARLAIFLEFDETTSAVFNNIELFSSSGSFEINGEKITYTGKTGDTTLTGLTRGVSETEDKSHYIGSIAQEFKTEHIYAIEGGISSIDDIYIGDILIDVDNLVGVTVTKYVSGHPSYPDQACIGLAYDINKAPGGIRRIAHTLRQLAAPTSGSDGITSGVVKPMSMRPIPGHNKAWDGSRSTYYDSSSDPYYTTDDTTYRFCAFKFTSNLDNEDIPPGAEYDYIHLLIDTNFASIPKTVKVGGVAIDGCTGPVWFSLLPLEETIDPTGADFCEKWFEIYYGTSIPPAEAIATNLLPANFSNGVWVFVAWEAAAGADIRIYDIHLTWAIDKLEDFGCPQPCPYCDTDETLASAGGVYGGEGTSTIVSPGNQPPVFIPFDFYKIYADVSGLDSGTTEPEAICSDIITNKCGLSITKTHATTGYDEVVVISQPPDVRALLDSIALQAKCISFFTPTAHVLKQMTGTYSTDATINACDMVENQAWCNYTNKSYISNKFDSKYNYSWWGLADKRDTVAAADASSQSTYGILSKSEDYPYIPGSAQAQAVLNWRLADLKEHRLMVEFVGTKVNNINRKIGNVIKFGISDSYVNSLLAGLVGGNDQFLVLNIVYPDGAIRISCIKL